MVWYVHRTQTLDIKYPYLKICRLMPVTPSTYIWSDYICPVTGLTWPSSKLHIRFHPGSFQEFLFIYFSLLPGRRLRTKAHSIIWINMFLDSDLLLSIQLKTKISYYLHSLLSLYLTIYIYIYILLSIYLYIIEK